MFMLQFSGQKKFKLLNLLIFLETSIKLISFTEKVSLGIFSHLYSISFLIMLFSSFKHDSALADAEITSKYITLKYQISPKKICDITLRNTTIYEVLKRDKS